MAKAMIIAVRLQIIAAVILLILNDACVKREKGIESALKSRSITGRVMDEKRQPIQCSVQLIREHKSGDGRHFMGVAGTNSNAAGEYRFENIAQGEYLARAVWSGTRPPSANPDCYSCCESSTDLMTSFYKNSPEAGGPTPFSLGNGQLITGIDIYLPRVPVFCVRGEVRGIAGLRSFGITVERWDDGFDSWTWGAGVINEKGRFLLTFLPAGTYSLKVTDGSRYGQIFAEKRFEVVDRNIKPLILNVPALRQMNSNPKK